MVKKELWVKSWKDELFENKVLKILQEAQRKKREDWFSKTHNDHKYWE